MGSTHHTVFNPPANRLDGELSAFRVFRARYPERALRGIPPVRENVATTKHTCAGVGPEKLAVRRGALNREQRPGSEGIFF
jgi:hypothetical protein